MNTAVYKDILQKNLLSYAEETMPQNWRFQQDNDPKHIQVVKNSGFLLQI